MINLSLPGKSLFSPRAPSLPPATPPAPVRTDPAISAAKKKLRFSETQRAGAASTVKTSPLGVTGSANITRPGATPLG